MEDPKYWDKDDGKRICTRCHAEVIKNGGDPDARPQLRCAANHMDIEDTFEELDDLTFFEEEILAPIQPLVRVYTLYSTGLTEMRGHVANWAQNGPQTVREIPCKAKELKMLLIRRFPRDPDKSQRVPFMARPDLCVQVTQCPLYMTPVAWGPLYGSGMAQGPKPMGPNGPTPS